MLSMTADILNPSAFIGLIFLLGLLVGSFLNVVAYRLPKMLERQWQSQARAFLALPSAVQEPTMHLAWPPSHCPACGHKIRALENIPLLSWFFLRGQCAACDSTISPRYPLVEFACAVLSAIVAWQFGVTVEAAGILLLTWVLLVLSLIDLEYQILPDDIVLPFIWIGLLFNSLTDWVPIQDALWGAILGYLSLYLVFWLFKLCTGKEGMGYGDFKLLAMLGAWGGWQVLPLTLFMASLVGAVLGSIILKMRRVDANTPLPFGPYLALAGWIALLWGEQLTAQYIYWLAAI